MKKIIIFLLLVSVLILAGCTEELPESIDQSFIDKISETVKNEGQNFVKEKVLTKENVEKVKDGAILVKDKVFTDENKDKLIDGANSLKEKVVTEENKKKLADGLTSIINKVLETDDSSDSTTENNQVILQQAIVVRVVDGDTLVAKIGSVEHKIRLIGVNTPESVGKYADNPQPYGKKASDFTKDILKEGRVIYLEKDIGNTDKYDRLLRYVWLEKPSQISIDTINNSMFNAILLNRGMANTMTIQPNTRYAELFVSLERKARESNIGLWGTK